jgi:hypothetical protein
MNTKGIKVSKFKLMHLEYTKWVPENWAACVADGASPDDRSRAFYSTSPS